MKLLVGLGNPGPEYAGTRHNVGVVVLEHLARAHGIALDGRRFDSRLGTGHLRLGPAAPIEVALLAPQTFMNRSGRAVAAALAGLGLAGRAEELPETLFVVLDDVDLPLGRLRLRPSGGAGGHRGLADVIARVGSREFPRLRIGVGRPPQGRDTADHVLEAFGEEERARLPGLIERATRALEAASSVGVAAAMNAFNRDPEGGTADAG